MSKKIKIFLASFVALAIISTAAIFAAGAAYDSSSDPLISLSFLTEIFKPEMQREIREANDNVELVLQSQIDSLLSKISNLEKKVAELSKKQNQPAASAPTVSQPEADPAPVQVYTILELKRGDVLVAEEICELVLRAGTATVMTAYVDQGLLDCTDGCELLAGADVPQNHFVMIPRGGDGRGITVTSDVAFVMVKGAYSIVKP